jgi:hypothetical protein
MSDLAIRRAFRFSLGTLLSGAHRLLGALQDGTFGPPMVDYLSAAFVADFENQIAQVNQLSNSQSTAAGFANSLTFTQTQAEADFILRASGARRAARFALAGQDALLRSEFQVGTGSPASYAVLVERGRKVVTACRTHAAALTAHGWPVAATDRLQSSLEALEAGDGAQEAAKAGKQGSTAQLANSANRLFRQCGMVQNAARQVYPKVNATLDSITVEARARFLLGAFPPRQPAAAAAGAPTPGVAEAAMTAPSLSQAA